jgi:hypothetical protein
MFIELMLLLGERTVMLTVARIDKDRTRVNVIPTRKREDENAALCAPLSFSGTPEEVDGKMARNLGCGRSRKICGSNTRWRRRRQRWTPRRRPHVSGPAGKQVRPQRKRNCKVDNKPIRQGPKPGDQENPPLLPACRPTGRDDGLGDVSLQRVTCPVISS